jgi:hypothetical protein
MPDYYVPWSEREGLSEVRTEIQDSGMDEDLRVDLWNALYEAVLEGAHSVAHDLMRGLWPGLLRQPADQYSYRSAEEMVKDVTLSGDWHLVCDIMAFCAEHLKDNIILGMFTHKANQALHRGKSAWHFVGRQLVRYIGEAETKAISVALQDSQPFSEVHKQLNTALAEFSSRDNPNYGHAAKESISALETLVRQVVGDPSITLGKGLDRIRQSRKLAIHGTLLDSFEKLWGYACDKGLLRHGAKPGDPAGVSMEEAQLVLVACAAIISFLIARAQAEGILDMA